MIPLESYFLLPFSENYERSSFWTRFLDGALDDKRHKWYGRGFNLEKAEGREFLIVALVE